MLKEVLFRSRSECIHAPKNATKRGELVGLLYRMLLVSNENWVGKAMLALRPKGSKS
jgi:hypothetical protein